MATFPPMLAMVEVKTVSPDGIVIPRRRLFVPSASVTVVTKVNSSWTLKVLPLAPKLSSSATAICGSAETVLLCESWVVYRLSPTPPEKLL